MDENPYVALTDDVLHRLTAEERDAVSKLIETEEAIARAAETGQIDTYQPLPHQLLLHESEEMNRWLLCANRVGKSYALCQEAAFFALRSHPYREVGNVREIWMCCPSFEKSQTHQIPMMLRALGSAHVKNVVYGQVPRIELHNGCLILFKTYEQKPMKFESSEVDLIVFDEEPPWAIFEACWFRRGAGRSLNIAGGATMIQGLTWLYDKVVLRKMPSTEWWNAKLDDNPYIAEQEKKMLREGISGVMKRIRVDGEILAVGGTMRFNPEILLAWQALEAEPKFVGRRENGRWVQDQYGPLTLYDLPDLSCEYILGCDGAEGLNTNYTDIEPEWDQTSIQILNRQTREFVGDYTTGSEEPGWIGEEILPAMSEWFNGARANIELNNHGHAIIALARKRMSSRLHSPTTSPSAKGQRPHREYGFVTTSKSRNYLIDTLANEIERSEHRQPKGPDGKKLPIGIRVYNPATVRQLATFIRKSNGRVEHQDGCKDDRVFAMGLALTCHKELPAPRRIYVPNDRDELRKLAWTKNVASLKQSRYFGS